MPWNAYTIWIYCSLKYICVASKIWWRIEFANIYLCIHVYACVQFACQQLLFLFLLSRHRLVYILSCILSLAFAAPPLSFFFILSLRRNLNRSLKKPLLLHFICTNYKCHEHAETHTDFKIQLDTKKRRNKAQKIIDAGTKKLLELKTSILPRWYTKHCNWVFDETQISSLVACATMNVMCVIYFTDFHKI